MIELFIVDRSMIMKRYKYYRIWCKEGEPSTLHGERPPLGIGCPGDTRDELFNMWEGLHFATCIRDESCDCTVRVDCREVQRYEKISIL